MYDCVALVASQPDLRFRMFSDDPENEYDAGTAVHTLYGQSEPLQGVKRLKNEAADHLRGISALLLARAVSNIYSQTQGRTWTMSSQWSYSAP